MPNFESWNGSEHQLLFGVEQENFILTRAGLVPQPSQINELMQLLIKNGYHAKSPDSNGYPSSVNKDVGQGYLSIKNDFCTHIIECAFPPEKSIINFVNIYKRTYDDLMHAAEASGLQLVKGGLQNLPIEKMILQRDHPRYDWFAKRIIPPASHERHRFFTTQMCSTQVHLNILDSKFFNSLSSLYALEFLIPLLFSNSPSLDLRRSHCLRPLLWRDSLPTSYVANAFPGEVPRTEAQYSAMLRLTDNFTRDYSFVCPREFGSVEFRSACSQNEVESVVDLISIRLCIALFALRNNLAALPQDREHFYEICQHGFIKEDRHSELVRDIWEFATTLTQDWKHNVIRLFERRLSR